MNPLYNHPIYYIRRCTLISLLIPFLLVLALLFISACSEQVLPLLPDQDSDQAVSEINGDEREQETGLNEPVKIAPGSEESGEAENHVVLPKIGIYSGKGSWDINVETFINYFDAHGYAWSEFDEQDVLSMNMTDHFDLIWFPGGFAAEYKNFIKDQEKIREFVDNGGMFAGSCAGAYYASDILRWLGEDHPYPLKFFPGKAIGPLAGQIVWGEIADFELNQAIAFNQDFPSSLPFYYFDGPYFAPIEEDDSDVVVLARYAVNNQPAIIAGRYGQGKYLLFGPHPELGGYSSASPDFNVDGGEGARWDWLNAALLWFLQW